MNLKPILFNTPMVQAILEGRKTQTRRIVKPQPLFKNDIIYKHTNGKWYISPDNDNFGESEVKPRYHIGDILYVRETWADDGWDTPEYIYKASDEKWIEDPVKWRPSIHMPKAAARIFLEVKDVKVEKIQDIDAYGAKLEGIIPCTHDGCMGRCAYCDQLGNYKDNFRILWDSTIKPDDLPEYGWDANPWVWIYEFIPVENPNKVNNDGN